MGLFISDYMEGAVGTLVFSECADLANSVGLSGLMRFIDDGLIFIDLDSCVAFRLSDGFYLLSCASDFFLLVISD